MPPEFKLAFDAIKTAFPRKPEHIQRFYAGQLRDTTKDADQWIKELKARLAASAKATREARTLLSESFGSGKYRISASGAVSVYGTMPNTNQVGWYLYADSVERAVEHLTWR